MSIIPGSSIAVTASVVSIGYTVISTGNKHDIETVTICISEYNSGYVVRKMHFPRISL